MFALLNALRMIKNIVVEILEFVFILYFIYFFCSFSTLGNDAGSGVITYFFKLERFPLKIYILSVFSVLNFNYVEHKYAISNEYCKNVRSYQTSDRFKLKSYYRILNITWVNFFNFFCLFIHTFDYCISFAFP